jgi:hypothetical protein
VSLLEVAGDRVRRFETVYDSAAFLRPSRGRPPTLTRFLPIVPIVSILPGTARGSARCGLLSSVTLF